MPGPVQPAVVAAMTALIEQVMRTDGYAPSVDPPALGYALVRLIEAFLYNDAVIGMRAEPGHLRMVLAALMGVPAGARKPVRRRDSRHAPDAFTKPRRSPDANAAPRAKPVHLALGSSAGLP